MRLYGLLLLAIFPFLALACSAGDAGPTDDPKGSQAAQPVARNLQERMAVVPIGTVEATATVAREQTSTVVVAAAAAPPVPQEPLTSPSCRSIPGEAGRPGEAELHVEVIADGLEIPWGLVVLPSGDLLVTERPGRVRLIRSGEIIPEPVLEFGVSILPPLFGNPIAGSEGGLLGLLLHPEFDANRQFYLFYNIDDEDDESVGRIERYVLSDDGRSATFDRLIIDGLPAGCITRVVVCGWGRTGCCT